MSDTYDYAIIRVVPRVERGELVNAGVILSCPTRDFLAAKVALDASRLRALDPAIDVAEVETAHAGIPWIAAGDPRGGPIALLPRSERFQKKKETKEERKPQGGKTFNEEWGFEI